MYEESFQRGLALAGALNELTSQKVKLQKIKEKVDEFVEEFPKFKPFFKEMLDDTIEYKALGEWSSLASFAVGILKDLMDLKHKDTIKRKADCLELKDILKDLPA